MSTKPILILLLLSCLFAGPAFASLTARPDDPVQYTGNAFWDAVSLYQYLHRQNGAADADSLKIILRNYISDAYLATKYPHGYATWMATNPFLARQPNLADNELYSMLQDVQAGLTVKNKEQITMKNAMRFNLATDALNSLGGIDVTPYVQAFADFLRDRIRSELTIAFLQKFKDKLAAHPEIQEILPKTWQVFESSDSFNIPSMGATYKNAFSDDLAHLPENFQHYIYNGHFPSDPGARNAFVLGSALYYGADQSGRGIAPVDILNTIDQQFGNNADPAHPSRAAYLLSVLNMFSHNLRSLDGNGWIARSDLRLLNPDFLRIFLALLYDKYGNLMDDTNHYLGTQTLRQLLQPISQTADRINQFLSIANSLDSKVADFLQMVQNIDPKDVKDVKQPALDLFLTNATKFTDLVRFVLSLDNLNSTANLELLGIARNGVAIAQAVHSNDLGKTVNSSVALIEAVSGTSTNHPWISTLKNILTFATDLVNADSSEAIKQVIEHYAAPVQSYVAIRQSGSSVTLGAYPGLYVGSERNGPDKLNLFHDYSFGVTAPIGLAISKGASDGKPAWSHTLFLSMVDIGAALSYRWNNQTSDIPQKITLGQIFSPGVHYIAGIKNSPLVFKLGYQYAPQLREITADGSTTPTETAAGVWRLSFGLCVDIPLYIFSAHRQQSGL